MSDRDFLSLLVDETYHLQNSGEATLSSLELKLKDYNLAYFRGEFIPQTQMLRFYTTFGILDVPVNWSVFAMEKNQDAVLSAVNDKDNLFRTLKSSWNLKLSRLLITHADGFCYLVGLLAGEENHLHDILNPQEILVNAA